MNPNMSYDEIGYEKLLLMIKKIKSVRNDNIFIVNADDIEKNTHITVKNICSYINIPFKKSALKWQPTELPEWSLWKDWHKDAAISTKIITNSKYYHNFSSIKEEDKERIIEYYDKSVSIYDTIMSYKNEHVAVKYNYS